MKNHKVLNEIKDELDTLKESVIGSFSKSGEALSEEARLLVENTLADLKQRVGKIGDTAREKGAEVDEVVRANPWKVAGIALAAGFVLGFISRRPKG